MRTKISLAALLAATCLTAPALGADLYTKAPPPVAAPIQYTDWSGVYVGLEVGYGWGHNSFDPFNSVAGFGGAGNIANILNGGTNILFPDFHGVGPISSINTQGWMAGGFAGAQKQWGSWVLGVEADFDAADIHGSVRATGVQHDVLVTSLGFGSPSVSGNVVTQVAPVDTTGQAFFSCGVPAPGCANGVPIPPNTLIPAGTIIFVAQGSLSGVGGANNIGVPGPGAGTTPATGVIGMVTTVDVRTNAQGVVTVPIPQLSVPGQNVPLLNGVVNASVLQQVFNFADVTRTLSIDTKIDELGSLRGKVGFTPARDWLLYATGGLAWAHATSTVNAIETLNFGEGPLVTHAVRTQGGGTMLGWALGAGVDWKHQIDQGSAIVLGLQYLHYEFPKNTLSLADGGVSTNFVNNHQSVDTIKGRVSYLFNIH